MGERVFVTGAGAVLPGAGGPESLLEEGATRLVPTERGRTVLAAAVTDPDLRAVPPLVRRRMSRLGAMASVAAVRALEDAGLDRNALDRERTGICVGTGLGCTDSVDRFFTQLERDGPGLADPALFPNGVPNAIASQVAIFLSLGGPNVTVSQREVSGEAAIALGAGWIRSGRADTVLVGGADELTRQMANYATSLSLLAPADGAVLPLHRASAGTGLGEGAAFLVLEGEATTRDRRVELLRADVDAAPEDPHGVERDGATLARLLVEGVERCGAFPGLVLCGANGHPPLDAAHAAALAAALGDAPVDLRCPKAVFGESFSAGVAMAGAARAALAADSGPEVVFVAGAATGGAAAVVALGRGAERAPAPRRW